MEKVLIAAVFGTMVMTSFSYIISELLHKQFKEPILIKTVLTGFHLKMGSTTKQITAWVIHFAIGILFVFIYDIIWKYKVLDFSFSVALFLGAVSGLIGILGWRLLFEATPFIQSSKWYFLLYYTQLLIAHILFALSAFLIYTLYLREFV